MQTGEEAPFKVTIKPRSPAHAELIRRECKSVADDLESIALVKHYFKASM
jgi:hypothetical protein